MSQKEQLKRQQNGETVGKEKVDSECRLFNQKWTSDNFFVQCKEMSVCLICQETVCGSTYICEQTFSCMKLMKNTMRSRLTDEYLHQSLRLAVTGMEPDI